MTTVDLLAALAVGLTASISVGVAVWRDMVRMGWEEEP